MAKETAVESTNTIAMEMPSRFTLSSVLSI